MEAGRTTNKNFPEALREILEEREISYPKLARFTKERAHRSLSKTMLNLLARGEEPVNKEQIEIISAALKIDPTYFKEYREFMAYEKIKKHPALANIIIAIDEELFETLSEEELAEALMEDIKKINEEKIKKQGGR